MISPKTREMSAILECRAKLLGLLLLAPWKSLLGNMFILPSLILCLTFVHPSCDLHVSSPLVRMHTRINRNTNAHNQTPTFTGAAELIMEGGKSSKVMD